jgi:hypothetical protein
MKKIEKGLKKKVGPFPRWAWIAIVGTVIVGYLYYRSKQAAAAQAADANNPLNMDPYSSYNSQSAADAADEGAEYGYPAAYPTGGAASEPYPYYGPFPSGTGNSLQVPTTTGAGPATPAPAGGETVVIQTGKDGKSTSNASRKKTPTNHKSKSTTRAHHPASKRHTSTGGGAPNRHRDTHVKKPATGSHKTTSTKRGATHGTTKHHSATHAKGGSKTKNVVGGITSRGVAAVTRVAHSVNARNKPQPAHHTTKHPATHSKPAPVRHAPKAAKKAKKK